MAKLKEWVMRYVFAGRASTAADADTNEVVVTDDGAMKVELSNRNMTLVSIHNFDLTIPVGGKWQGDYPVNGYDQVVVGVQGGDITDARKVRVDVDWWDSLDFNTWILTDFVDLGTTAKYVHGGRMTVAGPICEITIFNNDTVPVDLCVSLYKRA